MAGKGIATPKAERRRRARAQDVDRHVGARIRERRVVLGLTQQQLADLIGVTYQQAHKYERGINRISAGRLHKVAEVLEVPITYFFEGLQTSTGFAPSPQQRMLLDLARSFAALPSRRHQEALCALARILAEGRRSDDPPADALPLPAQG